MYLFSVRFLGRLAILAESCLPNFKPTDTTSQTQYPPCLGATPSKLENMTKVPEDRWRSWRRASYTFLPTVASASTALAICYETL